MKQIPEDHIQLVGRVTIGTRGQIVIPADVREQLGLLPGEHALALLVPGSGAVAFVHEAKLQELIARAGGSLAASLSSVAETEKLV
jgi:AbrB family looped-hinge helix DNA binding protein